MIRGRCPICERTFEIAKIDDLPTFPFCSDRCRLIDLGRWINGTYKISGPPGLPEPSRPGGDEDGD
jgi:uncharacterized protein